MSNSRIRTVSAVALASLVLSGLPVAASADPGTQPGPGVDRGATVSGIGDPYWPLDGNGGIDVKHYDIHDRYDFDTGRLEGATTVTLRATKSLPLFHLDLLLPVSSVLVDGQPASFGKPNKHELRIKPATALAKGDVVDVVVEYGGKPSDYTYAGEGNWLADGVEVVTMNEPHMAPWWFPSNDHPSDKATFDITVTGPKTHQVVSNGLLQSRTVSGDQATTHWSARDPMATYLAFFALGRYRIAQGKTAGVPWYVAVSKQYRGASQRNAMRTLRKSGPITKWLSSQLGPYPFESTGGLITPLQAGFALENQTRPTYGGFWNRETVVHELAHQWFGDSVSVKRWRDIWINEGFASFMEALYAEKHGGQKAQAWLLDAYSGLKGYRSFWRVDLTNPGKRKVFDQAVYTRGAMALQALRHRIGHRDFMKILRTWVRENRNGNASVREFRRLATEISGERLGGFFKAWLQAPRAPKATKRNGLR
ncbi:M1 family metallopeptidase [Nocardioides sp. GXZ039]|uniref:M1 family metallopeptidase n=1 Tax=Nocardioides sp. GXZ039 TaxID=3136018 RepID=UPI0030F3D057